MVKAGLSPILQSSKTSDVMFASLSRANRLLVQQQLNNLSAKCKVCFLQSDFVPATRGRFATYLIGPVRPQSVLNSASVRAEWLDGLHASSSVGCLNHLYLCEDVAIGSTHTCKHTYGSFILKTCLRKQKLLAAMNSKTLSHAFT